MAQFYTLDEDQFYDQTSTYEPIQRQIQEDTNRYFEEFDRQREQEKNGIILPDNYPFVWNNVDPKLKMNLDERYKKIRELNKERMDRIRKLNNELNNK